MREFYERCTIIYDDYRTAIPSYAAAALSFYLLLLLIPAFTLIAIGTSLFNIDMTILQNIIEQFVVKEYAQMLIFYSHVLLILLPLSQSLYLFIQYQEVLVTYMKLVNVCITQKQKKLF